MANNIHHVDNIIYWKPVIWKVADQMSVGPHMKPLLRHIMGKRTAEPEFNKSINKYQ